MSKISVIIPAYNCADTIVDVLKSIEAQTMVNCIKKVVVVNDGSKDATSEVVNNYSATSKLAIQLVEQQNKGVSAARNEGMKNAGDVDWIAFCDSDDIWHSNKIEEQMNVIENNDIDFLGGPFGDKVLKIGFKKITELHKATVKEICIRNFPQPSTVIMKKKIYDEMGGFDEKQRYAEDGNYFLKICAKYNFYYLPKKLIEYGYGKRGYGVKGLSANLKGMYLGNIKNLKEMLELKYISRVFYMSMRFFYWLKYVRRILVTRLSR